MRPHSPSVVARTAAGTGRWTPWHVGRQYYYYVFVVVFLPYIEVSMIRRMWMGLSRMKERKVN